MSKKNIIIAVFTLLSALFIYADEDKVYPYIVVKSFSYGTGDNQVNYFYGDVGSYSGPQGPTGMTFDGVSLSFNDPLNDRIIELNPTFNISRITKLDVLLDYGFYFKFEDNHVFFGNFESYDDLVIINKDGKLIFEVGLNSRANSLFPAFESEVSYVCKAINNHLLVGSESDHTTASILLSFTKNNIEFEYIDHDSVIKFLNNNDILEKTQDDIYDNSNVDIYNYRLFLENREIIEPYIEPNSYTGFIGRDGQDNLYWQSYYSMRVFDKFGRQLDFFSIDSNEHCLAAVHPSGDVYFFTTESEDTGDLQLCVIKNTWDPEGRAKWYAEYEQYKNTLVCTDDKVDIRKEPNSEAEAIGTINNNERAEVLDQTQELTAIDKMNAIWYKIKTKDGTIGWSYGWFFEYFMPQTKVSSNQAPTKKSMGR